MQKYRDITKVWKLFGLYKTSGRRIEEGQIEDPVSAVEIYEVNRAMRCPDCSFDNPEGMKFCGNCGVPLCSVCPSCGSSNPVRFKFCGGCGALLTPPQASDELARIQKYIPLYLAEKIRQSKGRIEGERKNVTVVFADVSGFTAMSETHDPEEVSDIVTACHTMLGKIVYKYEGVVDKIIGDGLMAIFGVPTHEDDPERAILSSLEMHQGMKNLPLELQRSMGVSLGLSVGINTGVVVIGDIGTDLRLDYTVIGDVVNTASRVQDEAESGEILVTFETYQRTAHCFDFQALEPIRVKGKRQPLRVYKVLRPKEKRLQTRGIEGLSAPLIGRDAEFVICKHVVDQLMVGKGGVLLITGEAGFGKSRLAKELKEYVGFQDITWLEGKCVSHFGSINYFVFMDALRAYFNISSKDDSTEIEHKIRQEIEKLEAKSKDREGKNEVPEELLLHAPESIISIIGFLLSSKLKTERAIGSLAESERKLQIFTAVKDMLTGESQLNPVLLVLDDLHWADELSIELLRFLIKELSQDRVTFVCIYRPPIAGEPDIPVQMLEEDYSQESAKYTRITLNPLSDEDSNILLESLLAVEALPSEMKRLILDKAEGNPFYLEEVTRSIIDNKTIERRDGKWLAVKELVDVEIPGTIRDVIMARIDRLEEEQKRVLQYASVVGRSFEHHLLSYLVTGGIVPHDTGLDARAQHLEALDKHLKKLEEMGFISLDSERSSVENAFIFRHALIHDVAYSTILIRRRKDLHEMVGIYYEEFHSSHLDELYEILAYHYSNSNNTKAALSYLIKAGNKNLKTSTGSVGSALRYFHKALDILSESSLPHDDYALYKRDIYDGMGEAYRSAGKYKESLASFQTVLQVAEQVKDYHIKAKVFRQIANCKAQVGDWEDALKAYGESLAIARDLGDLSQMGFVYVNIGYGCFERGDLSEATKYSREALKIGEQIGDLRLIGDASNNLGMLATLRQDFDEAVRNYQVSLRSYKELGESHCEAQAYQNLGVTYFKRNEMKIADKYYKESLKISEKCGYSRLVAYTYLNRAEIYLWQLDLGRAINFCNRAFQVLRTLDDKWARAEGYKFYGMIYRRERNFQAAKEAFCIGLQISEECNYLTNIAEVYCEMGLMYKEEGMLAEALEHFGRSREIFEKLDIADEVQRVDGYITEAKLVRVERQTAEACGKG